jgi:hypothetical protein
VALNLISLALGSNVILRLFVLVACRDYRRISDLRQSAWISLGCFGTATAILRGIEIGVL